VIEVQGEDPVQASFSGTVTIDLGSEWMSDFGSNLTGKNLSVMVIDKDADNPVSGAIENVAFNEWNEEQPGVFKYNYSFENIELDPGSYYIYAIIDLDGNGIPGTDEPQGFNGDDIIITSSDPVFPDKDIFIETSDISGNITIINPPADNSYDSYDVIVQLFTSDTDYDSVDDLKEARFYSGAFRGDFLTAVSAAGLNYEILNIPAGLYLVFAFIDSNGNDEYDEGELFGYWNDDLNDFDLFIFIEDMGIADIEIEIPDVVSEGFPELTITSPVDGSALNSLQFMASGTLSDDIDDVEDYRLDVYVFRTSDITEISSTSFDYDDSPRAGQAVYVGADGSWTTISNFNVESSGNDDYTIVTTYTDTDGNTAYGWSNFTISGSLVAEGLFHYPIDLIPGVPFDGQVGGPGTSSFYRVKEVNPSLIDVGSAYAVSISGLTGDARIYLYDIFSSPSDPEYFRTGAFLEPDSHAFSLIAEDSYFYLEVESFATSGTDYEILVEPLIETIDLSGTVTIATPLPVTGHALIVNLKDGNVPDYNPNYCYSAEGDAYIGLETVNFSVSGIRPGYYSIYIFYDMNDDGFYQNGLDYTGFKAASWYLDTTENIAINIELLD